MDEPTYFVRPNSRMEWTAIAVIVAARCVREESEGHQTRSVKEKEKREGEENDILTGLWVSAFQQNAATFAHQEQ